MDRRDLLLKKLEIRKAQEKMQNSQRLFSYYPDSGPLRRELYVKNLEFFAAGPFYRERLMMAANRVGKTEGVGGYEMALHLTGLYPEWWPGVRYNRPIDTWAAGDTNQTVRDILQHKMIGPMFARGTGLLPAETILKTTTKTGVPDAIETVFVKHASGGVSQLGFKSYDQKRKAFQGTAKDIIWMDEEPPIDVYTECLLRTAKTDPNDDSIRMIMATFTPLMGLSDVVLMFLPNGQIEEKKEGSKFVLMATWDDAPHLSKAEKEELWEAMPPHQRDARSKGIPQLGAGAIYPVPESDLVVDDFPIPDHWPKVYALDVGWNRTAALWGALDRESDVLYLFSEYYRGQAEPSVHAQAVKARGDWIPGVIDPAARGRGQKDGSQLMQDYIDLGLDLEVAFNGVESGIYEVWQRMSSGRLKVFRSLQNWLAEFRIYRRDEKGKIVKERDHLMDDTRYLVMSGLERAKTKPGPKDERQVIEFYEGQQNASWMG